MWFSESNVLHAFSDDDANDEIDADASEDTKLCIKVLLTWPHLAHQYVNTLNADHFCYDGLTALSAMDVINAETEYIRQMNHNIHLVVQTTRVSINEI